MFERLIHGLRALARRRKVEEELDDEYRFHLEELVEQNRRRGMSERASLLEARRSFGDFEQSKEESRDARGVRLIEETAADVRYGVRSLRKSPGFAVVAILSLTLGIGANTAIFQLLDAVRLRVLPVDRPTELVEVTLKDTDKLSGRFSSWHPSLTNPLWEAIRDHQTVFSSAFAYVGTSFNLAPSGEIHSVRGLYATGDFFSTLGVQPAVGRLFDRDDDRRGTGSIVAVISYPYWQREYGGASDVVGTAIMLDGHPAEIIGVSRAGFFGVEPGRSFDVAIPVAAEALIDGEDAAVDLRDAWWLTMMGRLAPGVTVDRANEQLASISKGVLEATLPPRYDAENADYYLKDSLVAISSPTGISELREDYERPLWLLLGIAAVVLVIACANLANLLLARASTQEREMAVRLALGASRARLVRQLLTENLILASAGAVLGLAVATYLSSGLLSFLEQQGSPLSVDLGLDWRVFGFTAALAISTCVVFGIAPAVRATGTTPGAALKSGGRSSTEGRERLGLRRALVASQVSMSLVLVVGAMLFVRTLTNLLTVDPGFDLGKVGVANIDFTTLDVAPERRLAYKRELVDNLRAIPGVADASDAWIVPMSGSGWNNLVWMGGADRSTRALSFLNRVGPEFFTTLGIPLVAGRAFDGRDTVSSPRVAIVNEEFAKRFSPDANPIGRSFFIDSEEPDRPPQDYEIVGLVKNSKYRNLREKTESIAYVAMAQDPKPDQADHILIRSQGDSGEVLTAVRETLTKMNPTLVYRSEVLEKRVRSSLVRERLMATLSGFFGVLALLIATIGLYGVTAYSVSRRTHEIGIRMALGALPRHIAGTVVFDVAIVLGVGLFIGGVTSIFAAKAASSLLFGVAPADVTTLGMSGAILALVALAAALVPARRASSVDPMTALRDE